MVGMGEKDGRLARMAFWGPWANCHQAAAGAEGRTYVLVWWTRAGAMMHPRDKVNGWGHAHTAASSKDVDMETRAVCVFAACLRRCFARSVSPTSLCGRGRPERGAVVYSAIFVTYSRGMGSGIVDSAPPLPLHNPPIAIGRQADGAPGLAAG